jgi:ABC-2 type transport system permease protein
MFLGGVYLPRFMLPEVVVRISDYTPPGVQALQDVWTGTAPQPLYLVMMAGITLVAGAVAAKSFRWE